MAFVVHIFLIWVCNLLQDWRSIILVNKWVTFDYVIHISRCHEHFSVNSEKNLQIFYIIEYIW